MQDTGENWLETASMTTPAEYRERWPHSMQATYYAAGATQLHQRGLHEDARPDTSGYGYAQSLFLAVLREANQGE